MTATVTSRAAIRARIAEWQRQDRDTDYRPTDLYGQRVRWFRVA